MKKLILFFPRISGAGGAERLLFEEYKFFKAQGVQISLFTYAVKPEALFNYTIDDLVVIGARNHVVKFFKLLQAIRKFKPELVIAPTGFEMLFLLSSLLGFRYVLHIHGTMFRFPAETTKYSLIFRKNFNQARNLIAGNREFIKEKVKLGWGQWVKGQLAGLLNYWAVRKASAVLVLSEQMRTEVRLLYRRDSIVLRGALPRVVFSWKSARDLRAIKGWQDKIVIFSLGRLDQRKRVNLLIRSLALALKQKPNLRLVIGGTGEEKENLVQLVSELGLGQAVEFAGFINDRELYDYYQACDIFASPAWADYDLTVYEALAFGKKVVLTDEMEFGPDLAGNERIFLPPPEEKAYAQALLAAIDCKVSSVIDLQPYTWDNYFTTIQQLCERVLKS